MQIYSQIEQGTKLNNKLVLTMGTFDGLHLGHQALIQEAQKAAKKYAAACGVFSFANHPLETISPENVPPLLFQAETKHKLLAKMGVDVLFEQVFSRDFAALTPELFWQHLWKELRPKAVVVGDNYTFGAKGAGSVRTLQQYGSQCGCEIIIVPGVFRDGQLVSSSRIRELLLAGNLVTAAELLGRKFSFQGEVIHGEQRGRLLGFPTANLAIDNRYAMPPNGVYAALAVVEGKVYNALANIGNNPTFADCSHRLEVNLRNFAGDLYGKQLEVVFLAKLRDEQKFPSVESLIEQMGHDAEKAKEIFNLQASPDVI